MKYRKEVTFLYQLEGDSPIQYQKRARDSLPRSSLVLESSSFQQKAHQNEFVNEETDKKRFVNSKKQLNN
ncbi:MULTISPECIES: hypothetical protein [Bacillaceae]|uniref:Uncharacterized protein n=1 Tax=Evansella alkalicola TaxID=745819 RepID=A0ABS6JYU3_9BACI|nr:MULTISPECIES: hypothetical protein [Bacillaceae]MBU9723256.1 hypothetical protein [Bacillus alkalicola]